MDIKLFQDTEVTVMGLGRFQQGSGMATARWLISHGAQVLITDLKSEEELKDSVSSLIAWFDEYRAKYPSARLHTPLFALGAHREEDFQNAKFIFQNPDVMPDSLFLHIAKERKIPIYSDVSLFFELYAHPIIAVTGTKGKSSTSSWIFDMCSRMDPKTIVAGNIKVSPLEYLDDLLNDTKTHPVILELSSSQLETLESSRAPEIGVLINIYPDHLNRHRTMKAYINAKMLIFKNQTKDQSAILNWDQQNVRELAKALNGKCYWFSTHEEVEQGAFVRDGKIVLRIGKAEEIITSVASIGLFGEHNLSNALASAVAARLAGVSAEHIRASIEQFAGIPDRQEILRSWEGIVFVNDTTATQPDAAIAAIKRFAKENNIILLAGGASKKLPMEEFAKEIIKSCKYAILFAGAGTDELVAHLRGSIDFEIVDSMQKAVDLALSRAQSGDIVLLSPGTASFGVFKNEFDRGDQFKEVVMKF
ncbi:MAG: hypothetical protein ACD_76C00143G0002 [uncultured bacterium]|nr:MAG: hypothetical protein ACD_76C00143G0002 [uncultured bacterium]HBD05012.1 UDP-N-acetylmuramoyl-L-alanine--D-glutamate ligase [Candidatus Uhrbacteria bacterium]